MGLKKSWIFKNVIFFIPIVPIFHLSNIPYRRHQSVATLKLMDSVCCRNCKTFTQYAFAKTTRSVLGVSQHIHLPFSDGFSRGMHRIVTLRSSFIFDSH